MLLILMEDFGSFSVVFQGGHNILHPRCQLTRAQLSVLFPLLKYEYVLLMTFFFAN